ncbi:CHAD domain-containing protein [Pontiella agarivorans]|uniref:CHAD domain-containing protein n=1 Tax=Pontiella agarivorans TaxID=3038953 RepID=A0ABU5N1Q1_9BACT|nr:CHAD domain-containing protein [Pontiella agarivorans]MDZ8120365.1 CHAD domain-containing protein [Pontiella agarivorans]
MSNGSISGVWKWGTFDVCHVARKLPRGFSIEPVEEAVLTGQMLDTFNEVMRESGCVLLQTEKKLVLIHLQTGKIDEQTFSGSWKFADELNAGAVQFQCLEKSELRAFIPLGELTVQWRHWRGCDELQKTVMRLVSVEFLCGEKRRVWLSGEALRGYESETARILRALEKAGFEAGDMEKIPMSGSGRSAHTPKSIVAIEADWPIFETANQIVLRGLDIARRNEAGAADDVDTEFLHDYRVSLRRVRSLLSLFKGVYDDGFSEEMKSELRNVMKRTNRLRDLDVYLLGRKKYYARVPESVHAGLDIMFGMIEAERLSEQEKVAAFFRSSEYDRRMEHVRAKFRWFENRGRGSRAAMPTLKFARRVSRKRYERIVEIAPVISENAPDVAVHELRIQCKKFRYLLEFFAPLFPAEENKVRIKSLKRLQDVLGRFNDYSVQREALSVLVKTHPVRGKKGLMLAESAGALEATLFQLQLQVRQDVEKGLEEFVKPEPARVFEALFSKGYTE